MEQELIHQIIKNDNKEALAKLLQGNYEIVFRYMIKLTLSKSAAEDLTQETMLKAIEKIELYDITKSKFSTWLISIGRNIFVDNMRKKKHSDKYIDNEINNLLSDASLNGYNHSWHSLLAALDKLSDDNRVPLILKHYYGYSLEEISNIMSIPVGTVKSRIHNTIKSLKKEMA